MLESAFSLPSLVEVERKQLLSQRKKAYSLIFLMIMLAQTSYIQAMQGWTYPVLDDNNSDVLLAGGVTEVASDGDVRLHLDPTNTTSYGGSGTNFADLSGYNNNGTISGATWDESRYRFEMDGCTGSSAPFTCDDIKIPNSQSLRPVPPMKILRSR